MNGSVDGERDWVDSEDSRSSTGRAGFAGDNEAGDMNIDADDRGHGTEFDKDGYLTDNDAANGNEEGTGPTGDMDIDADDRGHGTKFDKDGYSTDDDTADENEEGAGPTTPKGIRFLTAQTNGPPSK